ncbi:MAG: MATE family efflux transporter [Chloroflexota bacterium]
MVRARGMPARGMPGGRGNRSEVMGRESIWKLLFKFSGPAIIAMMVTSSYNLADAIFVGRLGAEAMAAMAVSMPIVMITMSMSMGTGIGAASLIGRYLGAGQKEAANRVAGVAITTSILISLFITIVCLANLDGLLGLFGASGPVLAPARAYVSIILAFTVVSKLSIVLSCIVRAEGNPVFSSGVQVGQSILNIITDPIFILGWGFIPAFGIAGAAGTTSVAWTLGTLTYIGYFVSGKSSFRLKPGDFIPDLKIIREIYRVGIASIARGAAGTVVQTVGNRTAASFGIITLAIKGILLRASSFAFMPTMGIGQGVLPLVAYNFGAKQKGRVGEVIIKASMVGLIWGGICFVFVQFFPTQLVSIFNSDPDFLAEGVRAIRIFSIAFFTVGIQMIMSFYFQGVGKGIASLILASSRQVIFLLPAYFILPRFFGATGIWLSFAVADILSFIVTLTWTSISFRKMEIPFTLKAQPVLVADPSAAPAGGSSGESLGKV